MSIEKSKEELELEKLVFGDIESFDKALTDFRLDDSEASESEAEEGPDLDGVPGDNLFFVDDGANPDSDNQISESEDSKDDDSDMSDVWMDSDDEKLTVSLTSASKLKKLRLTESESLISGREYERRLRARFLKMNPAPSWTLSNGDEGSDSDVDGDDTVTPLDQLLAQKTSYISAVMRKMLPTSDIDITRLQDVNRQHPSKSAIQTLDFHPTHPLVLSGGYDRTLRIYHIDGKVNPVATSLHIRDSPFQTALFHPDGKRVFAGGRRRYLYIWNLETGGVEKITRMYGHGQTQQSMENFVLSPCGQYVGLIGSGGWMNVLGADNGQWVAGAKIDGVIADIFWGADGIVTIASTHGDIYEWSVESRQFIKRWKDVGAVGVTRIARSGRWCAVGASNGMINVYDLSNPKRGMKMSEDEPESYEPHFVIDNLVTTISSMKFSPDGQILVIASRAKRDALRLVHVPSFTVFKNWPTSSTPLGKVTSLAFAPGGQMLSAGNESGHCRLWALNHYQK